MANRVIDADGHICEPPARVERLHREALSRPQAIRVERDPDGRDWISINGKIRRNLRPAAACVPWGMDDPDNVPTWDDILPGSYDGGARAKVLEEEGIERSLLYPSLYLIAGDIEDPAVAAAACHGYNEWIADMCRDGRGKLSAVGIVPLQSVEAAAKRGRAHRQARPEGRLLPAGALQGPGALRRVAEAVLGAQSPATACSPPCMAASAR